MGGSIRSRLGGAPGETEDWVEVWAEDWTEDWAEDWGESRAGGARWLVRGCCGGASAAEEAAGRGGAFCGKSCCHRYGFCSTIRVYDDP